MNGAELALVCNGRDAGDAHGPSTSSASARPAWRRVLADRDVLLVTLSYSCMNFVFYVLCWGLLLSRHRARFQRTDRRFPDCRAMAVRRVGRGAGGWACDRLCKQLGLRWGCRWPIIVGLLASGALMLGVAFNPDARVAALMLGLCFSSTNVPKARIGRPPARSADAMPVPPRVCSTRVRTSWVSSMHCCWRLLPMSFLAGRDHPRCRVRACRRGADPVRTIRSQDGSVRLNGHAFAAMMATTPKPPACESPHESS